MQSSRIPCCPPEENLPVYDPFPAASLLYGARVPGQSLTGLPDTILPANLDQAYAVQFALCY